MDKLSECSILLPTQNEWGRKLAARLSAYRGQSVKEGDGASSVLRIIGRDRVTIKRADFDAAGCPANYWKVLAKTRAGYLRQETPEVIEIVSDPAELGADADPLAALLDHQPCVERAYLDQRNAVRSGTFASPPNQPSPGTARAQGELAELANEVGGLAEAAQARRVEQHRGEWIARQQPPNVLP